MKRFLRTGAGKTVLFMICVLSVITLFLSIVGIVAAVQYVDEIYLSTEEQFVDGLVLQRLRTDGYQAVYQTAAGEFPDAGNVIVLEDMGNAAFIVKDETGKVIARSEGSDSVQKWKYDLSYAVLSSGPDPVGDGSFDIMYLPSPSSPVEGEGSEAARTFTVSFGFRDGLPQPDIYKLIFTFAPYVYKLRYGIYAIAAVSLLTAILSFVALMYVSGHRPDTEEIVPGPLNRVPFDLMAAGVAAFAVLSFYIAQDAPDVLGAVIACTAAVILLCLGIGLCMSMASRIKQGNLLKNTLTARVLMLISGCLGVMWGIVKKVFGYFRDGLRNIPVVWKTVLAYLGFSFVEMIMVPAIDDTAERVALFAFERMLLLPGVVIIAIALRKLYKSGQALAGGDLSHYTDTKGMFWDLKRHGEDLNNIAKGMAIAVDDRLKSERMKTELITNVSHDIKTPLTSIINYATLIGEEQSDNEKINEYSEVLVRQSERLKRLIEDLVEASKASTGNLEVEPVPCSASVFLDQASGEYSEKLEAADLTLVTRAPEKEMTIMADGRRMWRIFDNLMNNICKYAMPGTRVYLSLEEENGSAVFTFKNTSRDELNISEEELMERFTRGDSSRNTEGNGLGLSIARSMAELQGGTLNLSIDGDLFKAILAFPVIG